MLDTNWIQSEPKKLRKALKKLPKNTSVEHVHRLRTHTRRMEAILSALDLDSRRNERRLLKAIKRVRSKAGQVRDMDVLIEFVSGPHPAGEKKCAVQLLECLGGQRRKYACKLRKLAASKAREVNQRLKRSSRFLNNKLQAAGKSTNGSKWASIATAAALQLETELRAWPELKRSNLHPFRLKVKELRYVLQMAKDNDHEFITSLGNVKDKIGEWHDWLELAEIAKESNQHPGCRLRKHIHVMTEAKFKDALGAANRLRRDGLGGTARSRSADSPKTFFRRAQPALASASALAA